MPETTWVSTFKTAPSKLLCSEENSSRTNDTALMKSSCSCSWSIDSVSTVFQPPIICQLQETKAKAPKSAIKTIFLNIPNILYNYSCKIAYIFIIKQTSINLSTIKQSIEVEFMKNRNRYHIYDPSTNIIVSSKTNRVNHYAPFQTIKQRAESNLSDDYNQQTISSNIPRQSVYTKIFDYRNKSDRGEPKKDRGDVHIEEELITDIKKMNMINAMNKLSINSNGSTGSYKALLHERTILQFMNNKKLLQKNHQGSEKAENNIMNDQAQKNDFQLTYYQTVNRRSLEQANNESILIKTAIPEQIKKRPKEHLKGSISNFISTQSSQYARLVPGDNQLFKANINSKLYNSTQNRKISKGDNTHSTIQKRKKIEEPLESIDKNKKSIRHPLFYLEQREISHIKADSFIVMEYPSCQTIIGQYARKVAEIASLTKIMTFYTVWNIAEKYEKDISTETIVIDEQAQWMTGTSAQVYVGDVYTIKQLLYGIMLPSGNDAAVALAKWGGALIRKNSLHDENRTEKVLSPLKTFIRHMNFIAKNLNLWNTKFANPHGLPNSGGGSNPEEMALLVGECLKIDLFRQIVKTQKFQFWVEHEEVKREVIWENTNKLLRRPNFIGVKTGVTITAGPCLATCYECGSKVFIIILLRTTKLSKRFKETRQILALALSKLKRKQYSRRIKQILKNDIELDSDNSEDEQQFCYERNDARQMGKRNKILSYQM